jgi:hypothetical protein
MTAVSRAIPAGLPPELLRRTLLVYSDLVSRTLSFRRVEESQYLEYPLSVSGREGKDVFGCLGNGAVAAARFADDLAGLRALAQASPPVTKVAPDSRAAAGLALRILSIGKRNGGCKECGGWIATRLAQVIWQPRSHPGVGNRDGTIDGIEFTAVYRLGHGWDVETFAC